MKFAKALIGLSAEGYPAAAAACEAAGFSAVSLSDHVVSPATIESKYPYTPDGKPQYDINWDFPDTWVAVGAMSSVTSTLEFLTNVFVLPARNPILAAKAIGTASVMSNGRVSLGIGAGWMREEFELLGQQFKARGRRMDEIIDVMRTLWAGGFVEHHGEFYDFEPLLMKPTPADPVPILVGGHSEIALRRAARLDGWIGVYYSIDELEEYCKTLQKYRAEIGHADEPFHIVASPWALPTPKNIHRLEAMGVGTILTSAWIAAGHAEPNSVEHAINLIGEYGEQWIAPLEGS